MSRGVFRPTTTAMRYLLFVAGGLVLIIGLPQFVAPTKTDTFFSWTVNPPLTAAFLGGAYLAAFLLEVLSARRRIWAHTRIAVPAVFLFTSLTLVVTLIHRDKFHLDSSVGSLPWGIAWTWLIVYVTVPVIMGIVWLLQIRTTGAAPAPEVSLPAGLRGLFGFQAAVMLGLGVALLIAPTSVAPTGWPWVLSALTGRAIGAWLFSLGVAAAQVAWENDVARQASAFVAYMAFAILQIVAVARFATAAHPVTGADVLDWGALQIWFYLGFVVSVGLAGVWGWTLSRRLEAR
jgi:hypothetical protein